MRLAILAVLMLTDPVYAADDALDQVNAQRAARGLPAYVRDPNLTAAAMAAADYRAAHLMFGHVPGTPGDFAFLPAGMSTEGVAGGCAAYPAHMGFLACATYDSYTYAGAARTMGADGKMYNHIFVSGGPASTTGLHASGSASAGYSPRRGLLRRR